MNPSVAASVLGLHLATHEYIKRVCYVTVCWGNHCIKWPDKFGRFANGELCDCVEVGAKLFFDNFSKRFLLSCVDVL